MPRAEVRRRSINGIFFLTTSSFINLVVGFAANLVFAWLLLPEDFGVVAVGSTALLVGNALADGGLGSGLVRRPESPTRAELRTMNGIQLTLALALCLPTAAIALGFGRTGAVTAVMILSLPITVLQAAGRITLARTMQFDRQFAADAGSQLISQAVAVTAVVLGAGVWGLAAGVVLRGVIATALISMLSTGFVAPSLRGCRAFGPLLRFGVKFQANWYAVIAREQGLNILIVALAGVSPLGIWTLANRIFQLPSMAFNSLYVVGFPAMASVLARGESIGPIILRTVRRAAIAGTLIFATFAAACPELIPGVFGAQWRDVALILPWICLSTLVHGSIAVSASSYLSAADRAGIVAVASTCLGVIWLATTAVLLPIIGVVAIGIGNLAGALVDAAVLNAATKRASGVSPYRPLMRPLAVALVTGGLGLLLCVKGPNGVLTGVAAGTLTFVLATFGLWLLCRRDFVDLVRLLLRALRSAMPRLRRRSVATA
jgi:O-antigen/teichoic acid export membrane protein